MLKNLEGTCFKENDSVKEILIEMATIGSSDGYKYSVYTEPMKNPSFHLKYKTDFEIVLTISDYKILEVKFNNSKYDFKKGEYLPNSVLKTINEFMAENNKKDPRYSNKEALDFAWKLLNDD